MKESNTNQITALYCRLSQEDLRAGESLSIENQRLLLKEYADKNGLKNCQYYIDDGYSGVNKNRPEYVRMLKDIESGLVGTVIVKDQSRLGRDHLETGRLMEILFPSYDVRFIAISDGVDSINGLNDMSGIKNYFNDFFAQDTSRKIRTIQKANGERGERVGASLPYGYMKDPNDSKRIIPDPETAPIVKRIFEMYANGVGMKKICNTLEEEKVLSPSVYAFNKTGSRSGNPKLDKPYAWSIATVRSMLLNQMYCGDTVNFKTYTKSNKLKKRIKNAPEKVLIFENTHEAIVDRGLFELVQKHFVGRKRANGNGEMDKYAGYLYCAECGSRLYLHRNPKTYNNFMCGRYEKRKSNCTAHYIREEVVDAVVLEAIQRVTKYARERSDEFYEMAMSNGENEAVSRTKNSETLRNEYEAKINQLESAISMLYMDRVTGRVTPERYDSLAAGYEKEQSELKAKLQELDSHTSYMAMKEKCVKEFIENAKKYVDVAEVTPQLLRAFIWRIEVHEKAEKRSRTCLNDITVHFSFLADKEIKLDGIMIETFNI